MAQKRDNGTGTIYQRANKTWVGKIYLGLDETGKEKFKYFSGKTETEVKKKIREYNQSGTRIETKKISLQEYLNNWLKTYKRGTIKASSYDAIEKTAKNQIIPYIGMIQLQEITATDIQALLVELKEKGYSYSTVKKAHDCLNAMFEHATIADDVAKNPMLLVKMLARSEFETKEIRYFSEEECALIIEECSRQYKTGKPIYQYADAYILMLNTGIRLGEAIGLKKTDWDKKESTLHIQRNIQSISSGIIKPEIAKEIASEIESEAEFITDLDIHRVESMVFEKLIGKGQTLTAKAYEGYRSVREFQRDTKNSTDESIMELLSGKSDYWNNENSNKNAMLVTTQRDYMAGIQSEDMSKRMLLPPDVIQAHEDGIIHFHDIDYFGQRALHNCDLIDLDDMLQNGTVISDVMIEKPHSFSTACNIATQIIAQVASSQYGGQSITLAHLAPFVDVSRKKIRKQVEKEYKESYSIVYGGMLVELSDAANRAIDKITEDRLREEINKGVQTIQYQVVTLMTTNGQAPFLSINMYLNEAKDEQTQKDLALIIEEVLKQRIQGVKNEKGVWVTPAFPKLLYVLEEDNVYKDSKYFYLTKLAAECSAKRLVPDYISEKKMLEYKIDKNGNGNCYPCMGCRSFLTPYVDPNTNKPKYYGRFNQGVVTINLVDIALSSGGDEDTFWTLFEARTELCHKALQLRHQRLEGTLSDVAPILWQHGALARLNKGETIDSLLHNGYSTISLGYAGLYECVKYMTGVSHTDPKVGAPFGLKVMQALNDKCNQWKEAEHIDYSLYGSPIESTTYKFAKCLKKRFGIIEGITDRDYITNSYHVPVFEEINAFDKLELEAQFQKLSPGGAISYVEIPNMNDNLEVVIQLIQFIYDHIMYAELNTKSDYCMVCGYDKEIQIITDEKTGKLIWECPKCGNRDQSKMSVARRTCGYIGTYFWNQGRTQEIKERVLHIDDKDFE